MTDHAMNTPSEVPVITPIAKKGSDSLERLGELVNLFFDEELSLAEAREFGDILSNSPEARQSYIEQALIHSELIDYFREEQNEN